MLVFLSLIRYKTRLAELEHLNKKEINHKNIEKITKEKLMKMVHNIACENPFQHPDNAIKWLQNFILESNIKNKNKNENKNENENILDLKNLEFGNLFKNSKISEIEKKKNKDEKTRIKVPRSPSPSGSPNRNKNIPTENHGKKSRKAKLDTGKYENLSTYGLKSSVTHIYTVVRGVGGGLIGGGGLRGKYSVLYVQIKLSYIRILHLIFLIFRLL